MSWLSAVLDFPVSWAIKQPCTAENRGMAVKTRLEKLPNKCGIRWMAGKSGYFFLKCRLSKANLIFFEILHFQAKPETPIFSMNYNNHARRYSHSLPVRKNLLWLPRYAKWARKTVRLASQYSTPKKQIDSEFKNSFCYDKRLSLKMSKIGRVGAEIGSKRNYLWVLETVFSLILLRGSWHGLWELRITGSEVRRCVFWRYFHCILFDFR